jgi:pyruvate/2-oxoglutarate dehydrogenase complex dihydrolipoamide acyltransferase (E2) component
MCCRPCPVCWWMWRVPGQKVQAGERVAVIEAMKMENVLFATADGVVGKVLAAKGESLTVDQPIVEFVMTPTAAVHRTIAPRPFKVLGIQQIAIGGPTRQRLQKLWVDMLGLEVTGTFRASAKTWMKTSAPWARARSRSRWT